MNSGRDVLVHVAVPGNVFGHAARLGRGPRLATVIAAEPSRLLYLPEPTLDELGEAFPELWPSLTRLLYEQLGELVGVTRKTINQVLGKLAVSGCICPIRGRVEIVDRRALSLLARGATSP